MTCDEFLENRRKFVNWIYRQNRFTRDELTEAYKREIGEDNAIDAVVTVDDHLDRFVKLGALRREYDMYVVV